MNAQSWQPTASTQNLKVRAKLLQQIRNFFAQRHVLEVETPLLSSAIGTDVNLTPFVLPLAERKMFLQTSPEFAMKRLLADGSGPIFQICKAFRKAEQGSRHNPEFTLLEWYRPDFTMTALMDELEELVSSILFPLTKGEERKKFARYSYRKLFQQSLNIDPHTASLAEIKSLALHRVNIELNSDDRDIWLDILFSHVIEPGLQAPTFIYHYPKSQAALARITRDENNCEVAQRFELVCHGMELANGYFELCDAQEQQQRFENDQALRKQAGQDTYPIDLNLLAALAHGLPECSGVALGLDRLLMLVVEAATIEEVISFPIDRA